MDANVLRRHRTALCVTAALLGLLAWAAMPSIAHADSRRAPSAAMQGG